MVDHHKKTSQIIEQDSNTFRYNYHIVITTASYRNKLHPCIVMTVFGYTKYNITFSSTIKNTKVKLHAL